jgi:anti-sigma regulatory factor (Ser/Thr protein kinase)
MSSPRPRWRATFQLFHHPESVRLARLLVMPVARLAGFEGDTIRDIQVAVAEAVSNAYLHAYGGGPTGRIEVDVEFDGSLLTVGIHDSGRPVTHRLTVPEGLPPSGRGGRGLYVMARLMDVVEIRQGRRGRGTLVVLKKHVPPPPHDTNRS